MKTDIRLYAEALVPGTLGLASILVIANATPPQTAETTVGRILGSDVVTGALFLTASYVVGVVSIIISRFLIKLTSDRLRYRMLPQVCGASRAERDERYRTLIQETKNDEEATRRRERVLVIRSSFVPLCLIAISVLPRNPFSIIVTIPVSYLLTVTLLLLGERQLYDEAQRIDSHRRKASENSSTVD